MVGSRSVLFVLTVVALGAVGAAGWFLLRPAAEPPAENPPPAVDRPTPPKSPEKKEPRRTRPGKKAGPDGGTDDERIPFEGEDETQASFEEIQAAVRARKWLEVRRLLATGGGTNDSRVTDLLVAGLSDPTFRNMAAELAEFLKDAGALAKFLEVAKGDKDDFTRAAALAACAAFGGSEVLALAAETLKTAAPGSVLGSAAAGALGTLGTADAAGVLLEALRREPAGGSAPALIQSLGMIKNAETLEEMGRVLRDETGAAEFRAALAAALGRTKDPRVVPALLDAVRGSTDPDFRAAGFAALGLVGDRAAVQELLTVATSADNRDRYAAATALQGVQSREASALLAAELAKPGGDPVIRGYIVAALGRTKGPEAAEALAGILRNPDESSLVKRAAVRALADAGDASHAKLVLDVYEATPPADRDVRTQALLALSRLHDPALLPRVQRAFDASTKDSMEWILLRSLVESLKNNRKADEGLQPR